MTLVCLFCNSPLQGPEDAEYASGDVIECNECGESNDYDSVVEVAKEKGVEEVSEEIQRQLKKELGNLFKTN
ncbi:hypothetical protein [Nitrosococcus watsonii]|uniref:hypothetical protein n=1 Tax=Nitrosococcus watsonii TaxID=473531 RepID=UPI0012FCF840|nr:hypothetical protein [Nitrosococcus watsonii]